MKIFDKLKVRIEKELGLNLINFQRTYAGKHERFAGAFLWMAEEVDSALIYGSCETATNLLKKCEKLEVIEGDEYKIAGNVEII